MEATGIAVPVADYLSAGFPVCKSGCLPAIPAATGVQGVRP